MGLWDYIYNPTNISIAINDGLAPFLQDWVIYLITSFMGIGAFMAFLVPSQLATIWIERRLIARFQIRRGPNRIGKYGLAQPVADALKGLFKETWIPSGADKWVFMAAPMVVFMPAVAIYAVMPFGPGMVLVDLDLGLLYFLAISSIGVIGVFMAGWASNNKYSLMGSMRAVAQMVSYEIPMLLSFIGILLIVGSLNLSDIINWQIDHGAWFILVQPLAFIAFFIAGLAETSRTPFDMAEAESELGAGFHTEYAGMRFMMFYAAEYTHVLAFSGLMTVVFLGGWGTAPFLDFVPPWIWFIGKLFFVFLVLVWIRATVPRLRIDQLMNLAWKFLIPLTLINILVAAIEVAILEGGFELPQPVVIGGLVVVNLLACAALVVGWTNLLQKRPATA